MANKRDILTSIKNLDFFLKVPALKGATARINKNGNPFVYVGGFNMVFQLTHKSKKWAFRVWHVPMGENEERFLKISKYLTSKKLPYFAEFIYDENGILVNGELIDTIRMEWLDGVLFKEYLETNLTYKSVLIKLADDFLKMCQDLRDNQISHGDLQEGNILVDSNGNLKLVDYDSICIPEIEGQKEIVAGLKGYQHPSRFKNGAASLKADYFSELIIYLSILALAEKPDLWSEYQVKDTRYLLFSENDFEDFEGSKIYADLKGLSPKVDKLLIILKEYIETNSYLDLRPLHTYLHPPKINIFKSNQDVILNGVEISIEWEVENAFDVMINNGIGKVKSSGSMTIIPKQNQDYILTAKGFNESVEHHLNLTIFPTPIIKSLQVPSPDFTQKTILNIMIPETPKIELGISEFKNHLEIKMNSNIVSPQFNGTPDSFNQLDNIFNSTNKKSWGFSSLFNKIFKRKTI